MPLVIDFMRSVKDGAATTINCAVNPRLNSGQCFYYSDCAPKQPTAIARYYTHTSMVPYFIIDNRQETIVYGTPALERQ